MTDPKVITVKADTVAAGDMIELDVGYGHPMDAMCKVVGVTKRKSFFYEDLCCCISVRYSNEYLVAEFLPTHKVRVIKGA